MEQLIILVLIAVISFVNWLLQRSSELREKRKAEKARTASGGDHTYGQPAPMPEPERRPAPAMPNTELREIMEALGIPMEEPRPVETIAPPPLPEPAPEPVAVAPPPARPAAPRRPLSVAAPVSAPSGGRHWLQEALKSREEVRKAVVLREVLGPAKAWTH